MKYYIEAQKHNESPFILFRVESFDSIEDINKWAEKIGDTDPEIIFNIYSGAELIGYLQDTPFGLIVVNDKEEIL